METPSDRRLFTTVETPVDATGIVVCGRMMFTETVFNLIETVKRFGIDFTFHTGAYWEQSLTSGIKQAMGAGRKYLLFFDGDSVWEPGDVRKLYEFMESHPEVDAVCPVQADRNGPNPLCYNWQAGLQKIEYDFKADSMRIAHGHFGLTFIRTSVFKEMREPWLMGVPATNGTWDRLPGKCDPDTYFWLKFNKVCKTVYQLNDTVIGHMQTMIRWQTPQGVTAQGMMEYRANGKPIGCRVPTLDDVAMREREEKIRLFFREAEKFIGAPVPITDPLNTSQVEKADDDGQTWKAPEPRIDLTSVMEAVLPSAIADDNGNGKGAV